MQYLEESLDQQYCGSEKICKLLRSRNGRSCTGGVCYRVPHPGVQGLVNSFSVYIDLFVCLCSALIIILTDCFNVQDSAGNLIHVSEGSQAIASQSVEPGIAWAQEGLNSLFPRRLEQ